MDDDNATQDDPMGRLRASDPATDIEPTSGFIEATIARVKSAAADDPAGSRVLDLSAERRRRRRRWVPLAAAAAAALLLIGGGSGYAIATMRPGPGMTTAEVPTPAPTASASPSDSDSTSTSVSATGPAAGSAGTGMSASLAITPGWGHYSFTSSNLSKKPGITDAYAFDASAGANVDIIQALASALAVHGEPILSGGVWLVGSMEGPDSALSVLLDGSLRFFSSDPSKSPWSCADDGNCTYRGTPPSEEAAIESARATLTAVGLDTDAFAYEAQLSNDGATRTVLAWPMVDGQRIDAAWSFSFSEHGLSSVSGQLATVISIGQYPVVSEYEAFTRLSDPRFGGTRTNDPCAYYCPAFADGQRSPDTPPSAPAAGVLVPWPVEDVQIVDAQLKLEPHYQPDDSVLLIPTYTFTDAEGGTWSVIAVADEALDFSTE